MGTGNVLPVKSTYPPRIIVVSYNPSWNRFHSQPIATEVVPSRCNIRPCSDVRLLKEGCQSFQTAFQPLSGFNPFSKRITIASACSRFFRRHCLIPQTIASEPVRGWHGKGKPHSKAAIGWLYWKEHEEREARHQAITPDEWEQHDLMASSYPDYSHPFVGPDQIRHAKNVGEQSLVINQRPIHVDGYNPNTRTVFEFYGCFFHGCPTCFPNRHTQIRTQDRKTMDDLYQHTQARDQAILQAGYDLQVQWECEWNALKRDRDDIRAFVDGLAFMDRLEPRNAFFGGRTEAIQLYATEKPGKRRNHSVPGLHCNLG